MAKKKCVCICDEKVEESRYLPAETVVSVIEFLTGIIDEIIGNKISLDEIISLHKLIGKEYFDPKGNPYYVDDSYALSVITELGQRGVANIARTSEKKKRLGGTKCARTTSSTRRKASKRKNA